jgi:hypothetical protein
MPLIAREPNANLYPNLSAVLAGCVAGPSSQWPAVRTELRALCEALCGEIEERERALSDEQKDAERYRKLKARYSSAEFPAEEPDVLLVFKLPESSVVCANLDRVLDSLPEAPK